MMAISYLLRGHFPQCLLWAPHDWKIFAGPDRGLDVKRRNLYRQLRSTKCQFCIQQFIFFCSLRSEVICTSTFKFVPPTLFAFII